MGSKEMEPKVWLITGCSTGFGKEIAFAALRRGDKVIATARNPTKLEELKAQGAFTMTLDVLSTDGALKEIISEVLEIVGHIDILVNNAGFYLVGGVEECSASEVQAQFNTNVFGQLNIIRAVLPYMRARRSGVIANFGSVGGWVSLPAAGMYCATKAAIARLSESLRYEVGHLGIEVTVIEPGYFRTEFLTSRVSAKNSIDDLSIATSPALSSLEAYDKNQPGDPKKGAQVIVEVLTKTGRCEGRALPSRLALGNDAAQIVSSVLNANRSELEEWKDLVSTTDFDVVH